VAKSWSDMWEEDEEESEREEAARKAPIEKRSGEWDFATKKPATALPGILTESNGQSTPRARRSNTHESISPTKPSFSPNENESRNFRARESKSKASPKQVPIDKWAALGDKRRSAQNEVEIATATVKKRAMTTGSRKKPLANDQPLWHQRNIRNKQHPAYFNHDWRQHNNRKYVDDDEHEWVGGWQDFHL